MSDPFSLRLLRATEVGDPAADAVVAAFRDLPGGAGWRALDRELDLPGAGDVPALTALLAPLRDDPPGWFDAELADRGAVATWKAGSFPQFLALTYGSLAFGYQSARLARPLAATGRLEAMAPRRLGETSRWYMAATAPGGMRPGARGWSETVRIRLVHALVRDHLLRSPAWDRAAWGVPISAADLFATAVAGFHVVPSRALRDLGVHVRRSDRDAVAHLWRWIGFCSGVPEDLLPEDVADAEERVAIALTLDDGPNDDGPRLMRALLHHGLPLQRRAPRPVGRLAAEVTGGLARRWMGGAMADRLHVGGGVVAPLVPLVRPAARARDAVLGLGLTDERVAALELALARRVLRSLGAPRHALRPAEAEELAPAA